MATASASERPKLCQLCGSIPDRVIAPRCRKCGLDYAPDDIPQTFARPRIVKFVPPPEEQPKKERRRSYKKDPIIVAGIIEVTGELVRVEHFDCCVQRVVSRRHLRNARGGTTTLICKMCDVRTVRR